MSIPSGQMDVARYLRDMSGAEPVETHISAVFVGAHTAWKLKKAVRLPFLDFTAVETRRRFARRELELNHEAAPDIYRDVAAVVRGADGRLSLTTQPGTEPVLDWVLRMAPVPKADFLDAVASRGGLTPALLDALGDCVAQYHGNAQQARDCDSAGSLLQVAAGSAASARAAGLPEMQVQAWSEQIRLALEQQRAWLAVRAGAGFVRRGHGDLHLGNLCLWHGSPVPFDALEFDEAMATTDVGDDLAFLLMDLDQRVSRAAANRVLNRYVARASDAELTHGLAAFLSLRAMVRAHVHAASGRASEGDTYLRAALAYLRREPAVVLAIGGLQGTGKSTVARMLAPGLGAAPGALILRSDEIRKRQFDAAPEQRLAATAYSESTNAAVNATLLEKVRQTAAGGHSVIADATFLDVAMRDAVASAAVAAGVPFVGVWLHAPAPVLEARIMARLHDASDATVAVLRHSAARDPGPIDWLMVDASDAASAGDVIRRAIAARCELGGGGDVGGGGGGGGGGSSPVVTTR